MTDQKPIIPAGQYFPVFQSMRQGGLSIWLNRLSLLPLSIIPVLATFITLTIVSSVDTSELSPLIIAIIQIPSDFMIGLYTALIIMIIMAAPRDKDPNGPPMTFSIDLRQKRNVLIGAAIAHTLFGYLFFGGVTAANHLMEPMRTITSDTDISASSIIMVALIGLVGLYAVRFNLLPVLIVGDIDIKSFFKRYKMFGLSVPVIMTKVACMFAIALIFFIPLSLLGIQITTTGEAAQMNAVQSFLYNFISAIVAVATYAWMYASFAYGVRLMIEERKDVNRHV